MTYYALGKWLIEVQQKGEDRAKYGEKVIDRISEALTEEFGRGYSRETLRNARKFYQTYQGRISQTLFTEFTDQKSQTMFGKLKKENPFRLSWSHYLILMRVKNAEERDFYEIEAAEGNWTVRTLQHQYGSSLSSISEGSYQLIVSEFEGGKKADQPLPISGEWRLIFDVAE